MERNANSFLAIAAVWITVGPRGSYEAGRSQHFAKYMNPKGILLLH